MNSDGEYVFDDVLPDQCYVEVTPLDACKVFPIEPGSNQINLSTGTSPVIDIEWNDIPMALCRAPADVYAPPPQRLFVAPGHPYVDSYPLGAAHWPVALHPVETR